MQATMSGDAGLWMDIRDSVTVSQFTVCFVHTVLKYYYLFWKSSILNYKFSYIEALFSLCCNINIGHSPKP